MSFFICEVIPIYVIYITFTMVFCFVAAENTNDAEAEAGSLGKKMDEKYSFERDQHLNDKVIIVYKSFLITECMAHVTHSTSIPLPSSFLS